MKVEQKIRTQGDTKYKIIISSPVVPLENGKLKVHVLADKHFYQIAIGETVRLEFQNFEIPFTRIDEKSTGHNCLRRGCDDVSAGRYIDEYEIVWKECYLEIEAKRDMKYFKMTTFGDTHIQEIEYHEIPFESEEHESIWFDRKAAEWRAVGGTWGE